ncbi:histidine phosphatase family protein [Bacillus massiliglaciei]|uniref:histidine phosphatase family protein n=1 Tax=Bacillus massiliglaciei TaxID=1816693 RepID=UPI000DA63773|nr:histidine phosphatase family protein [Bacillus massiliglaciei]
MNTTFYLVRHGETDWNKEKRIQGRSEVPLNAKGIQQAKRTADLLATRKIEIVLTSPLYRARQTAKIISRKLNRESVIYEGLTERSFGSLEGILRSEAESKYGGFSNTIIEKCGGEKGSAVRQRGWEALQWAEKEYTGNTIAVVTHGAWLNAVLTRIDSSLSDQVYENCSVTVLICNENKQWTLADL